MRADGLVSPVLDGGSGLKLEPPNGGQGENGVSPVLDGGSGLKPPLALSLAPASRVSPVLDGGSGLKLIPADAHVKNNGCLPS